MSPCSPDVGFDEQRDRKTSSPDDWLQGVACLDPDRPPNDVPRHRWRQFVQTFLSPSENWAERAYKLGWNATALFGCAPKRPLDYLGSAGLLDTVGAPSTPLAPVR